MAKTPQIKNKKLYYRRADFGILKVDNSLEFTLAMALEETANVGDRTLLGSHGEEIQCSNYDPDEDKGLFLQLTTYTPDQPTSTIERSKKKAQSAVDELDAPEDKHFVDAEIFALVKDNDVILCPAGARETVAVKYISKALEQANLNAMAANLELSKVAKANKLDLIRREGVKEIKLGCTLYEASMVRLQEDQQKVNGVMSAIAHQIEAIFAKDDTLKHIQDRENVNVGITLSYDGQAARLTDNKKVPGFGEAGKKRLQQTSNKLLAELDEGGMEGFVIVTNSGKTITADEIHVSDFRKIKTLGKSLSRIDAWNRLHAYYLDLEKAGVLKQ